MAYVWVDLEMTGLDPSTNTILEVACLISDRSRSLHLLHDQQDGYHAIIHHDDSVLAGMNAWCIEQHGKSGLTQRVRESTKTLAQVEDELLTFIKEHVRDEKVGIVAGNSVHADVAFMKRYMPRVTNYLHYRIVDVSTVKELCRGWYPDLAPFQKQLTHRALDDILESIGELRYYQQHVFRP